MKENIEEEALEIQKEVSEATLDGFNEEQLWAIYIALQRVQKTLVKPLAKADKLLAKQIYAFGKKKYKWV